MIEIGEARQHNADAADDDETQEEVDGAKDDRAVQRVGYHEETLAYSQIRRLHGQPIRRQHDFFTSAAQAVRISSPRGVLKQCRLISRRQGIEDTAYKCKLARSTNL